MAYKRIVKREFYFKKTKTDMRRLSISIRENLKALNVYSGSAKTDIDKLIKLSKRKNLNAKNFNKKINEFVEKNKNMYRMNITSNKTGGFKFYGYKKMTYLDLDKLVEKNTRKHELKGSNISGNDPADIIESLLDEYGVDVDMLGIVFMEYHDWFVRFREDVEYYFPETYDMSDSEFLDWVLTHIS